MKKWTYIFFIIVSLTYSQKEANIWYFGEHAGLDFNSGSPVVLLDGALSTNEGCATISDSDGHLLFYTDGLTVYNRNHVPMPNGNGLAGNFSSTHSAIIVPKDLTAKLYYIFTVDTPWNTTNSNGLQYSEVDMSLDNGLGDVTGAKNIPLESPVNEKVTAIKNASEDGYWVVAHRHNTNEFIAYEAKASGVSLTPVVSAVGSQTGFFNIAGQIKISPDNSRLAVARGGEVQLFDFDNATGAISNALTLDNGSSRETSYGIEFSTNGSLLYAAYYESVYQYNLLAGTQTDIINSKVTLISVPNEGFASLQIAPDGKIYVARTGELYIDFIDYPNVLGLGCNYNYKGLSLGGRKSQLGLPTFVQSFFDVAFQMDSVCLGEITTFSANIPTSYDTLLWEFGDGMTSTLEMPTHTYLASGTYTATLTVSTSGQTSSNSREVVIYDQPIASQPNDLWTCDDNNDGFYDFDLTQQDLSILNGQDPALFDIVYYASVSDYTNNLPISNPTAYSNQVPYAFESIIASVKNKSHAVCKDTTSFNIQVFESPTPNQTVTNLSLCDDTSVGTDDDGIIQFDLTQKESELLNGQSSSDFNIKYYTDTLFSNEILNPGSFINTYQVETIFVQISNKTNTDCIANSQFEIEVLELPIIAPIVDLKQCDDDLDGFSAFNLNEAMAKITVNASNDTISFYETQSEANQGYNPILNVTSYTNQVVSTDRVWARVENANACYRVVPLDLIVSTTQIPLTYIRDFYECDDAVDGDSSNGISMFDFSNVDTEIHAMFPIGQQLIINYYKNEADALAENNPIGDISNYRNVDYPNMQNIYVRVDSAVNNDCLGLGNHITLHVEEQPIANPVMIPEQCDDDGDTMYAFDTSTIEGILLNGQTGMIVSYLDAFGNTLPSPLPNPFLTASQTITARVTNAGSLDLDGACYDEIPIVFSVNAASVAYPVEDLIECDNDDDGLFPFDTSNIENMVLKGQIGMNIVYTDELGNSLSSPLPNPFLSPSQTITVRVENPLGAGCFDETTFKLVVIERPILTMDDTWLICEGGVVDIVADAGFDAYKWSTGETSESIRVYEAGTYEVTATNNYGGVYCETSKSVNVIESNVATITAIETLDWTQKDNAISVFVEGLGDYEYSLDGVDYQDSNVFESLPMNDYTVYVRDKNGCGSIQEEVFLIFYPKFFTPNNDGQHDTWHIFNSNLEPNNKIYIYDRFGKFLKQLNPNGSGWDGTINGKMMPTSDYWFVIYRQDGKQYRGHFSLKL